MFISTIHVVPRAVVQTNNSSNEQQFKREQFKWDSNLFVCLRFKNLEFKPKTTKKSKNHSKKNKFPKTVGYINLFN